MQQRLGRDAAHVEAGTTKGIAAFNDCSFEAQLSAADGRNIAARASADDDHVIVCHWVDPLILERRYNVGIVSVLRRCVVGYCGPGHLGLCPRRCAAPPEFIW